MILLTGATGFLGSRLLKTLLDRQYDVICIKRKTSDTKRVDEFYDRCRWVDIESVDLESVFQENNIHILIHCATNYGRDETDTLNVYDSNLSFPLKLLGYAHKYGSAIFINTSTFFVREVENLWKSDEKLYMDSYVKSKYVFSCIAKDNIKNLNLAFVNLQLEHVYGNDGRKAKFVDYLLEALCSSDGVIALTAGKQIRDWVYIDDIINAYIVILDHITMFKKNVYYHYEVGTGIGTSLKEFVLLAHKLAESEAELDFGSREMAIGELMYSCADNRALCELGWKPQVDIRHGIKEIIKNMQKS